LSSIFPSPSPTPSIPTVFPLPSYPTEVYFFCWFCPRFCFTLKSDLQRVFSISNIQ
jgi:hypothetical protein